MFPGTSQLQFDGKIKKAADGRCPCKETCATVECGVGAVCRLDPVKCTTDCCSKKIFILFQYQNSRFYLHGSLAINRNLRAAELI